MPAIKNDVRPPTNNSEQADWWSRGYDWNQSRLACRVCGALIDSRTPQRSEDLPFWQLHDQWHEAISGS